MNDTTTARVAVIMQRRAIDNPWQTHAWEAAGVVAGYEGEGEPRVIVDSGGLTQWLHASFDIALRRAEAEGYFHNVSAAAPSVFVLWRMESDLAVPHYVTASYDEASRWMDGGAQVDAVPMPAALQDWVRAFVAQHYRPEPRKRLRPRSFLAPQERHP
jgi:hypothetical protein